MFNTTDVLNRIEQQMFVPGGGGGTWVYLGRICAARGSKLAPRSKKNFP